MVLRNGNLFADGQGVRVGGGYKVCEAAEGASEGAGGADRSLKVICFQILKMTSSHFLQFWLDYFVSIHSVMLK